MPQPMLCWWLTWTTNRDCGKGLEASDFAPFGVPLAPSEQEVRVTVGCVNGLKKMHPRPPPLGYGPAGPAAKAAFFGGGYGGGVYGGGCFGGYGGGGCLK